MHFRERGRSVQVLRTSYNEGDKKPSHEVLGRLVKPKLEIDDELKSKLTPDELAEVQQYLSKTGRREALRLEYEASRFPETLSLVTEWLATADQASAAAFAEQVAKPLTRLRRTLAKSGME